MGAAMRIVIVSGKGGAGKTTIAASLAEVWDSPCVVADADVEAPNLHLFLKPDIKSKEPVLLEVPVLDEEKCTLCGACGTLCRFKAIAQFGRKVLVFPDMCHGCGGCFAVCPVNALKRGERLLGELLTGTVRNGELPFIMGQARIGEAMTPPQLRALLRLLSTMLSGRDALIDAPPGVSCPAMTVAGDADLVLLAAEPTPFGFHDFMLAHQAFAMLGKPLAVAINRAGIPGNRNGDDELRRYCAEAKLPVLAELPFERRAAEQYASGWILATLSDPWRERFAMLRDAIKKTLVLEPHHA